MLEQLTGLLELLKIEKMEITIKNSKSHNHKTIITIKQAKVKSKLKK